MGNILAAFAAYETKVRAEGILACQTAARMAGPLGWTVLRSSNYRRAVHVLSVSRTMRCLMSRVDEEPFLPEVASTVLADLSEAGAGHAGSDGA